MKQTAHTAHGAVEYEVVECDSCGNETLPANAKDFTIGDREGKACEHCYENGPANFPQKTRQKLLQEDGEGITIVLWPVIATATTLGRREQEVERGYVLGSIGATLYALFVFGVLYLV